MNRPPDMRQTGSAEAQKLPPARAAVRFVVLHHTGVETPHFDLLIQWAEVSLLYAWRVVAEPKGWERDVAAERMADHRAIYMTYEGAISGGRGEVKRVAAGSAEVVEVGGGRVVVKLEAIGVVELPE